MSELTHASNSHRIFFLQQHNTNQTNNPTSRRYQVSTTTPAQGRTMGAVAKTWASGFTSATKAHASSAAPPYE